LAVKQVVFIFLTLL